MTNETKQSRKERQDKEWRKMIREISYKDKGEVWRRNIAWLRQGKIEIIN